MKRLFKRWLYRLKSNQITTDLIEKGLKVGSNFHRMHDVILDPSHCWLISIGNNVTMAPRVHVLAHDASTKIFLNYTRIGLVQIGNNVFIGADSVILPNVCIGDNVVIGANSTVSKDVPSNCVYAGSPAKFICSMDDFLNKNKDSMGNRPVYDASFHIGVITEQQKLQMIEDLKNGIGYVI